MAAVPFEPTAIERWTTLSAWRADAPGLVSSALERWHLQAGDAYLGGEAGAVLTVTTDEGRAAVLKVGFPHVEAVGEALALEAWGPELAPRVLRQDAWVWWLLLERVDPGTTLVQADLAPDDAVRIGARMLARLSSTEPPDGLPTVTEIVTDYLATAARGEAARSAFLGSSTDHELVQQGLAIAQELAAVDSGSRLVHGDLNPGNLLRAHDRATGWVAIDPKPMRGDPEFDLEPLVSQLGAPLEHAHPEAVLGHQLSAAADEAGLDVALAARWAVARAALDVSWQAADADRAASRTALTRLRAWAAVSAL
jgi:streptomycin 6-kinase